MNNKNNRSKGLKHGTISLAIIVIFITAVVLFNVVLSMLGDRFSMTLDLTNENRFGLTQHSKEFLEQVTRNVQIIVLCAENDMNTLYEKSNYTISASYFKKLFSDYKHYGNTVTVDFVDIDTNPGYLAKYNIDTSRVVATSIAIVRCAENGKYRVIDQEDILLTQSTGNDILGTDATYYNVAEDAITSAIQVVMRDNNSTAYLVEGHGEGYSDYFVSRLNNLGYKVEKISLTTILADQFAEDATIMISFAPLYDYTADEITKLQAFIENGGYYGRSFFFSTDSSTKILPNIQAYLDTQWGIAIKENALVDLAYQTSQVMVLNYGDENLARPLIARGINSYCSIADAKELVLDTVRFSDMGVLYSTLETAYSRPIAENNLTQKATDAVGAFPVVAYNKVSGLSREDGRTVPGYVCVASASTIFADDSVGIVNWGNGDYLDLVLYKLSNLDTNDEIYVPSKTIGAAPLSVMSDATTAVLFVLFAIVIPAAVVVLGLIVSLRRRHL